MSAPNTLPIQETAASTANPAEASPFILEFFVVEGPGYRCTAYRDAAGKWREAFCNEELFGDIQIVE
jgi:hypothetical protein